MSWDILWQQVAVKTALGSWSSPVTQLAGECHAIFFISLFAKSIKIHCQEQNREKCFLWKIKDVEGKQGQTYAALQLHEILQAEKSQGKGDRITSYWASFPGSSFTQTGSWACSVTCTAVYTLAPEQHTTVILNSIQLAFQRYSYSACPLQCCGRHSTICHQEGKLQLCLNSDTEAVKHPLLYSFLPLTLKRSFQILSWFFWGFFVCFGFFNTGL